MGNSVWFEGIAELNTLVVALESDAHAVAMKTGVVVKASAARVQSLGKQFCPVDTGALRGSIGTDFGYSGNSNAWAAEIGPTLDYAPFVEWGTERMAPHAYMGPAADMVGPEFEAAMLALPNPLGSGR